MINKKIDNVLVYLQFLIKISNLKQVNSKYLMALDEKYLQNLSKEEIEQIKKIIQYKPKLSLLADIKEFKTLSFPHERIMFYLEEHYLDNIDINQIDDLSLPLFDVLKKQSKTSFGIEKEIRNIFMLILTNFIKIEKKFNIKVEQELKLFEKNLKLKYAYSKETDFNYYEKKKSLEEDYLCDSYINELIQEIITHLVFCDKALENHPICGYLFETQNYLLEILLRSIFTILNDPYRLISDNEFYNSFDKENKYVKEAFINCFYDIENLKRDQIRKEEPGNIDLKTYVAKLF